MLLKPERLNYSVHAKAFMQNGGPDPNKALQGFQQWTSALDGINSNNIDSVESYEFHVELFWYESGRVPDVGDYYHFYRRFSFSIGNDSGGLLLKIYPYRITP